MSSPMDDDTATPDALARLADGTLPAAERDRLSQSVADSPQLRSELAAQEHAVALLRGADAPAPPSLHRRIEEMQRTPRRIHRPRWQRTLFLPGITAAAIAVAAIVVLLGGAGRAPTVSETARVALASATAPAPAQNPRDPSTLRLSSQGVPFPSYLDRAGWTASGTRTDLVHGRRIITVFYRAADGTRVGYAIVAGPALAVPSGGAASSITRHGVTYVLQSIGGMRLITWRRDGHTCVIAGRTVALRALLALAAADSGTR